jgi:hypothetical protein
MAKGILVDTWYYVHNGIENSESQEDAEDDNSPSPLVKEQKIPLQVRMLKITRETKSPPHETTSVSFTVENKDFKLSLEGTDIEALRKTAFGILDKKLAITWERWLLVRVDKPRIFDGIGSGVVVSWDTVSKGFAPDKSELLREVNTSYTRGNIWKISPWPGTFRNQNGNIMACIPDTKRNRDALDEFARRLDGLRTMMADFLSPEKIQQTLANLTHTMFLPAPEGERGQYIKDN